MLEHCFKAALFPNSFQILESTLLTHFFACVVCDGGSGLRRDVECRCVLGPRVVPPTISCVICDVVHPCCTLLEVSSASMLGAIRMPHMYMWVWPPRSPPTFCLPSSNWRHPRDVIHTPFKKQDTRQVYELLQVYAATGIGSATGIGDSPQQRKDTNKLARTCEFSRGSHGFWKFELFWCVHALRLWSMWSP